MKSALWLPVVLAMAVGACGHTSVKERETVAQQPSAPAATPARSCGYAGTSYASGSVSCQGGYRYQCVDGNWVGGGSSC